VTKRKGQAELVSLEQIVLFFTTERLGVFPAGKLFHVKGTGKCPEIAGLSLLQFSGIWAKNIFRK